MRRPVLAWLLSHVAVLGCERPDTLAPELTPTQPPPATLERVSPPPTPSPDVAQGAPDPRLPIVGDPLGLLSRPPAAAPRQPKPAEARPTTFDPGALMASAALAPPTKIEVERDPRAVARGQLELAAERPRTPSPSPAGVAVQAKSASEVLGSLRADAARAQVLFLYASYCKACRNVLPSFLDLVRAYRQRGVRFTAASVDQDEEQLAAYAPALGGVLPAIWIKPEGVTLRELRRAGLNLPQETYAIPLFAVFDRAHRLVSQGNTRELSHLPSTLDELTGLPR
jgi:thiol-disulfide isomerase/thioredoxin